MKQVRSFLQWINESDSYQGVSKHPKFGAAYNLDGFILSDHPRFVDYFSEVIDLDPSLEFKIFRKGPTYYLVQFFGHNIIKSRLPFEEGSNLPTIYGSINRLCEMENLSIKSIDYYYNKEKSTILFFLERLRFPR